MNDIIRSSVQYETIIMKKSIVYFTISLKVYYEHCTVKECYTEGSRTALRQYIHVMQFIKAYEDCPHYLNEEISFNSKGNRRKLKIYDNIVINAVKELLSYCSSPDRSLRMALDAILQHCPPLLHA
jgi:hypothetical protein